MGFPALTRLFGRKPAPDPPAPLAPSTFVNERGNAPYIAAYGGWAPTARETSVAQGNGALYDDRPHADRPMQEWYGAEPTSAPDAKNRDTEERSHRNTLVRYGAQGWVTDVRQEVQSRNPYEDHKVPAPVSRSPSNFREIHLPYGIHRSKSRLTGLHASMADMQRTYPVGGMNAPHRFRNTYRLEPPPRDALNMDVPATVAPGVPQAVYQSPDFPTSPSRGGSYRL